MRRRCCCSTTPIPDGCFSFWDSIGGADHRPGSTMTFSWSGGLFGNFVDGSGGIYATTFSNNPDIYPHFSPSLTSGSVELEYIGTTFGTCVWYGSFPVNISFPHITIPDDFRPNGAGSWSSQIGPKCKDYKISKTFGQLGTTAAIRLVLSPSYPPYLTGYLILNGHYAGYNPLTGNQAEGYGRFDYDKFPLDYGNCDNVDCDGVDAEGNPDSLGRVIIGPVNSGGFLQGFAGGRNWFNGQTTIWSVIPPEDIDFPNHRMVGLVGGAGLIDRAWCIGTTPFSCDITTCGGVEFSWGLFANSTPPFNLIEGTIEW